MAHMLTHRVIDETVSRVVDDYGDILKTENWSSRQEKIKRLKAHVQKIQGSEREFILKYYPDLFTTSKIPN